MNGCCPSLPGMELMRFGLKMLLYLSGNVEDWRYGDLIFPTLKASPVSAGRLNVVFRSLRPLGVLEGGLGFAERWLGSIAGSGSSSLGGLRPLASVYVVLFEGLPTMLPYLVICDISSPPPLNGRSSGLDDCGISRGADDPFPIALALRFERLLRIARVLRSWVASSPRASRPGRVWFKNEYFGAASNGEGVAVVPRRRLRGV